MKIDIRDVRCCWVNLDKDKENAIQLSENNSLNVYAKNDIRKGEEITINYKNAPDYIDKNTEGFK